MREHEFTLLEKSMQMRDKFDKEEDEKRKKDDEEDKFDIAALL